MDNAALANKKVTILMATYNGEKYIGKQLDSLLNQTHTNFEILVRDDGSVDNTTNIVKDYALTDNRITLIDIASKKKGACGNFAALYSWARQNRDVDYLMFTDQDDIWKPNKIELTLKAVSDTEKTTDKPVMAYGNLELVDADENKLDTDIHLLQDVELRHLLTRNYTFGCTVMLNKVMVHAMDEIDVVAENHDYWVALFAVAFGKTVFIDQKLILYRQHDSNASGHVAGNQQLNNRVKRYTAQIDKQVSSQQVKLNMIERFYRKYHDKLSATNSSLISGHLSSFNKGRLAVLANMVNNGIVRKGLVQTLVSYYFILLFYKRINYNFSR